MTHGASRGVSWPIVVTSGLGCGRPTIVPAPRPRRVLGRRVRGRGRRDALPGVELPVAELTAAGELAAVVVEAASGLAAQLARGQHPAQQRHGGVVRVAELVVERVEDG